MKLKKKRIRPSAAGKTSLRGTGCLSAKQAGETRKHQHKDAESWDDFRERNWMERLKGDMARAEAYFWRQTAERQVVYRNYIAAKSRLWRGNDFCFGAGKALA